MKEYKNNLLSLKIGCFYKTNKQLRFNNLIDIIPKGENFLLIGLHNDKNYNENNFNEIFSTYGAVLVKVLYKNKVGFTILRNDYITKIN